LISIAAILAPLIIVGVGALRPTAFWIAGAIIMIAVLPLFIAATLPTTENSNQDNSTTISLSFNFGKNLKHAVVFFMGFGAIIAGLGGWMEGSILAFLPVYCADIGLTSRDVAWLLTILGVGAMACQFAIGWLADNKGLLWTAKLCVLAAFLAVMIAILFGKNFQSLAITMFILGGVGGGLLTLGIFWATVSDIGEDLDNRVRQVSIIYTILSATGPFVAGFVVSHTNSASLFWQQLVVILIIVIVLIKHSQYVKKNYSKI
jgi:MFS family permease